MKTIDELTKEIETLQKEKEILVLRKEIAELKAEIDRLKYRPFYGQSTPYTKQWPDPYPWIIYSPNTGSGTTASPPQPPNIEITCCRLGQ